MSRLLYSYRSSPEKKSKKIEGICHVRKNLDSTLILIKKKTSLPVTKKKRG